MKVILRSDRPVDLRMYAKFWTSDFLWQFQTQPQQVQMQGRGEFHLSIPGRKPSEIEFFVLNYDDKEIKVYPQMQSDGELAPIVIYDGKRDYWSQKLREAALAVNPEDVPDGNNSQ